MTNSDEPNQIDSLRPLLDELNVISLSLKRIFGIQSEDKQYAMDIIIGRLRDVSKAVEALLASPVSPPKDGEKTTD